MMTRKHVTIRTLVPGTIATRAIASLATADKVEIALSDEARFLRQGTLHFMDNALNRSSGTIHARATVPDRLLTPGEFAPVHLVVGAPVQALLVPDTAVLPDQSRSRPVAA
jgi:multidrug efflux pump subunit AcrA (membrane-fusion protein)